MQDNDHNSAINDTLAVAFGLRASGKTVGTFAQYDLATEELSRHVSDHFPLMETSSMDLGIATASLALFPSTRAAAVHATRRLR